MSSGATMETKQHSVPDHLCETVHSMNAELSVPPHEDSECETSAQVDLHALLLSPFLLSAQPKRGYSLFGPEIHSPALFPGEALATQIHIAQTGDRGEGSRTAPTPLSQFICVITNYMSHDCPATEPEKHVNGCSVRPAKPCAKLRNYHFGGAPSPSD